MLPARYRMTRSTEFGATVSQGVRAVQPDLVVHALRASGEAADDGGAAEAPGRIGGRRGLDRSAAPGAAFRNAAVAVAELRGLAAQDVDLGGAREIRGPDDGRGTGRRCVAPRRQDSAARRIPESAPQSGGYSSGRKAPEDSEGTEAAL